MKTKLYFVFAIAFGFILGYFCPHIQHTAAVNVNWYYNGGALVGDYACPNGKELREVLDVSPAGGTWIVNSNSFYATEWRAKKYVEQILPSECE